MIREKGGGSVKLSQGNWVGRALGYLPALAAQVTQAHQARLTQYPQVDYDGMPFDFDGHKEDTNTIWGSRQERRRRDTFKEGTLKNLRGRRKGTLKVPGQVVSYSSRKT